MTSELEEKFFEAFGIKPSYTGTLMTSTGEIIADIDCTDCLASNMIMPDCKNCFSPAKQLEIIKLISSNSINGNYKYFSMDKDEITADWFVRCTIDNSTKEAMNADFSQALAQLTTELINAGELDKQKVKEILEK